MNKENVIEIVKKSSVSWQNAFNRGDAEACASHYEPDAYIKAEPFGFFNGREEAQQLWQKIISEKFSDVKYENTKIEVSDDLKSATLSSDWQMNKAKGIITKELWVIQPNGTALLREDFFEVTN